MTVEVVRLEDQGLRAPAAVEAAAYFMVAEALTNAAKYSGSPRASVRLERLKRGLRVRVAALDGTVEVSSPAGGPTVIDVLLPCVW